VAALILEIEMKRSLVLASFLLAACGDDSSDAPRDGTAVIVAGDFNQTGVLTTVAAPSMDVQTNAVAGVAGADPVVRRVGDELFVVNRFGGDNVTILDAATLALVDQLGTGAGSNPQDVAVVGQKLYIPAYGGSGVVVIDRDRPDSPGSVDLASLDAADGAPNCQSAYAVGTRVFVTCQVLDGFNVVGPGKVAVIDTSDDSVETTIDLATVNPNGFLQAIGDDLYVAGVNFTDASDGCLARITTGSTPTSSCVVGNADLAGYVNHLAVVRDQVFAAINWYDDTFAAHGKLVAIDLAAGTIGDSLLAEGAVPRDLAGCGEYLFVSDKAVGVDGVRVFHVEAASLTEETSAPLQIGLPPGIGDGIACMVL